MDAAQIGATASSYTGDPNLGGGTFGAFKLDLRPIEDLAKYTFLYNKSEYEQRQKDAEAAAKEIADMTNYDLTSGIEKDAKILQQKYDKITAYVRDNPNALDYRNKKEWMEYKRMRNDLDNDLQGAKVRNTMWALRQKEIQDETNTTLKADMQRRLDEEISNTDIRTPIKHSDKFNIEPANYIAPKKLSFTVSKEFPNYVGITDVLTTDMADVKNQANAIIMGLSKFMNPKTKLEEEQFRTQSASGKLEPILSANNVSSAMAGFVQNGTFDIAAAKKSGNSILSGTVANVEAYNRRMDEMVAAIKAGAFEDKLSGGKAAFGVNGLNEADYEKIDLNKGYITPEEYARLGIMAAAEPIITSKTDIRQTDNAIQRGNLAAEWARIGLARDQMNAGKVDDFVGADAVIRKIQEAITQGQIVNRDIGGKQEQWRVIADPMILKELATVNKDGTTTNVADRIYYNDKTNQMSLVYYEKDETGQTKTTASGKAIVKDEIPMNGSDWVTMITRQKNPNKDIGAVNSLVQQQLNFYNGNLLELANNYGKQTTGDDSKLTDKEYYDKYHKFRPKK